MADVTLTGRTVGQVCELTGVTVRTLHHYDEIGLLPPTQRTDAGYRLYDQHALDRLHEIIVWRALGFGLEQVRELLDEPQHDRLVALRQQRSRLVETAGRTAAMIAAVDAAITATSTEEHDMTDDQIREIFGSDADLFNTEEYEREAEERWGDTDAWRQSQERTAQFTVDDWRDLKADGDVLNARFVALLADGIPPDAPQAIDAAAEHRAQLERFYDVSPEMHRSMADMYVSDARFTAYYERRAPGLASYVRDAIHALHDATAPRP